MANQNFDNLINQALVERGGDHDELGRPFLWDPQNQGHNRIRRDLGGRVSDGTPLRLVYEKELTATDVNSYHHRFVIQRQPAENSIFRCLTLDQRISVSNRDGVRVTGHNREGRTWDLRFRKWGRENDGNMIYVLIGQWADMVAQNRWRVGNRLTIWGFPYCGNRDIWEFGPDHGYNEVHFVFTVQQ